MSWRLSARCRRGLAAAWLGALAAAGGAHAAPTSAYERVIAPIFRARCAECHGEQKQKAKLALHTWEAAARGSDGGPIWVAGRPGESVVLQRIRLPLDDEEHMPPREHPQPAAEEVALLERWIARGASATLTVEELQLSAPLATAAAELAQTLAATGPAPAAEAPWEYDPAVVERARAPLAAAVAELQRRFPGALSYVSRTSAELHFTAVGLGRAFGDAELAALAPLRGQLIALDLSGTAVTDASAARLASFSHLRGLRAAATELGDATATALPALTQLESLALPSTRVTPAGVASLAKLPALRRLFLAGTAAADAAAGAGLPVVAAKVDLTPPVSDASTPTK